MNTNSICFHGETWKIFSLNTALVYIYVHEIFQEQPSENLDDDEDKQNPAYIPRKGAFFEHDMRIDPDADEKSGETRG